MTKKKKKIINKKIFFSILTKNLTRKILIKNLVTFKRSNGIKDENFNMGVLWKLQFLGGGCVKPI